MSRRLVPTASFTGGVYDYAQPSYTSGAVVALGNVRTGTAAPAGNLSISNTTRTNALSKTISTRRPRSATRR